MKENILISKFHIGALELLISIEPINTVIELVIKF